MPLRIVASAVDESPAALRFSIKNVSEEAVEIRDVDLPSTLRVNVLVVGATKKPWKNLRLQALQ